MSVTPAHPRPLRASAAVLALIIAVLAVTLPATARTAMASGPADERAAEAFAVRLIADARASVGLPALRVDAAVEGIARARADDMRAHDYFAHTAPDGTTAFDLLDRSGYPWSAASEAIGWNDAAQPEASAARVVRDWLASGEHRGILLAGDRDTIGLASAIDQVTGRRTWVLVVVDRVTPAPPGLDLRIVRVGSRDASGARLATLRWSALPAAEAVPVVGVTVQVRPSGGRWSTVVQGRASATLRVRVRAPGTFEIRIRARGPAGAVGPWSAVRVRS
jgi:uncharacterized protein YkwD